MTDSAEVQDGLRGAAEMLARHQREFDALMMRQRAEASAQVREIERRASDAAAIQE